MNTPEREIRAVFNDDIIRVYQAYNDAIAKSALDAQTFVSPPFKLTRMTWIKPSFLWMMYRSGWGQKDVGQNNILAMDISREGFEWCLKNSCPSHKPSSLTHETWSKLNNDSPVKVQWDPERNIYLERLDYRSIQIGIRGAALESYINNWIEKITDVTSLADEIYNLVEKREIDKAMALLPKERVYPVSHTL